MDLKEPYKIIHSGNCEVKVPVDMFDYFNKYSWYINAWGYAKRNQYIGNGKWKDIFIHKEVNKTPDGMLTDHINRDTLDNRRCNLRSVTHMESAVNRKTPISNTSGFVGVVFNKKDRKFRGVIQHNKQKIHLGMFSDPCDAAIAYNKKSVELNGKYARLNTEIPYGWMLIEC